MLELRLAHADMTSARLTLRLSLLMTLPPLMWAGNAVVGRLMVGHVPPFTLNLLRWALAALLLAPIAWRVWRDIEAIRKAWFYLLVLGTLGIGLFNTLQYLALETSTALNVTLINASMPLWMLLVGALAFRQRPSRAQFAAAALSFAGVATVVSRGAWTSLSQVHFVIGDAYMLSAVMGWAIYSWLLVRPPASMRAPQRPDWDWSSFLFVQALFGLITAGGLTVAEQTWRTPAPIDWADPKVLAALLFVAVGPSIIAYRSWSLGVAQAGPATAAFFVNLSPLFAAVLSAWLLGEWPKAYHAQAFALIIAGIVVSTRKT
jgi:drug/metabolite transporter (DMT)-like permease